MSVWNRYYQGLKIRADYRVHDKIIDLMQQLKIHQGCLLDIACGEGALTQRIINEFPKLKVDVNDYDAEQIKCVGHQNSFATDLNKTDFSFNKQYDVIVAVEILEHLENPWNFFRNLKRMLNPGGIILLSTPNIDSVFDRLFYLIYGYHYYFGEQGIVNSGNHITMVPLWLMEYICKSNQLNISHKTYVDTDTHYSWRFSILNIVLKPLLYLAKNKNNSSINIVAINKIM